MTHDSISMPGQAPHFNDHLILLIDTSDATAQVSLLLGDAVLAERRWQVGPAAGREVLEAVNVVLAEAQRRLSSLGQIVVAPGPARRTSALRAGITVANILSFSTGIPLASLSGKRFQADSPERSGRPDAHFVIPRYQRD